MTKFVLASEEVFQKIITFAKNNRYPMEKELQAALEVLRAGGLILYPTDTVWGIGCDATNAEAVEKIYKLKQSEN